MRNPDRLLMKGCKFKDDLTIHHSKISEKRRAKELLKEIIQTLTLRHVLESNPGGRFPLKIGSIC